MMYLKRIVLKDDRIKQLSQMKLEDELTADVSVLKSNRNVKNGVSIIRETHMDSTVKETKHNNHKTPFCTES